MARSADFAWVLAGRLITALIALASLRVSTGVLPPDEYGLLVLFVAFQTGCGLFLVNPVGQHINRHTHAWADDGTLLARLGAFRRYVLVVAAVGAVAVGAWGAWRDMPASEIGLQMLALAVMVGGATWNATVIPMLNMLGYRPAAVGWGAVTSVGALLLSWALTLEHPGGLAWFVGQAVGMGIGAIGGELTLRRHVAAPRGPAPLLDARTLRQYCLPLAAATGLMWVQLGGYRLLIEHYWGLAALGLAAVGFGLAGQVWGLCESLAMQFLLPLFYRRISGAATDDGRQAFSDLLNVLGPVYLVIAGATVVAAPWLLTVLVNARYREAAIFVLFGALVECCRVIANLLGNAAQVTGNMRRMIPPYLAGVTILVGLLAWLGMQRAELVQAGFALVAAGFAMVALMARKMRREVPFRLDARPWALGLAVLVACILLAAALPARGGALPAALGGIAAVGAGALLVLALLLKGNPAMDRMLAIRLRKQG